MTVLLPDLSPESLVDRLIQRHEESLGYLTDQARADVQQHVERLFEAWDLEVERAVLVGLAMAGRGCA